MKLGLYGGSFDPIHAGHVAPVRSALEQLDLDRVLYLPTARPPHKKGRDFVAIHHRYTMVELALLDEPRLVVSPFELSLGRESYTVDSVRHFQTEHPAAELHLILGADSLARFSSYRAWEEIVDAAGLAILGRPGWGLEQVLPELPFRLQEGVERGDIVTVRNPAVDASSTRLRSLLAAGDEPPAGWMDERVLQYVRKYCLYR